MSRAALHAKRSYLRAIDAKAGPTGKERGLWLGTLDASDCRAGLESARTLAPTLPELDAAADAYQRALEKLSPLLNEASAYYADKRHLHDSGAKDKTKHVALITAFADFEQAHTVLAAEVRALEAGPFQRRLERLERDPSARLEYLAAKTVHDARLGRTVGPHAEPLRQGGS